jgi:ribosome-associated toxin RatA of RatAB toxin-antitoxin module
MATIRKSVIVDHGASAMFALVDAVEDYPRFLPWCAGVELLARTPEITQARIAIDYRGVKTAIATVNRKQEPDWMQLEFAEGPFERFHGHWRFHSLGQAGCRVEFELDYAFAGRVIDALLAPVIGDILETLVDRFVERADALRAAAA